MSREVSGRSWMKSRRADIVSIEGPESAGVLGAKRSTATREHLPGTQSSLDLTAAQKSNHHLVYLCP